MKPYELDPYYIRGIICADEFLALSVGYSDKIRDHEELNNALLDKYETVTYCGETYTRIKHFCTVHTYGFDSYYPALIVFIYSSQKEYDKNRLLKFEELVKTTMSEGRILL